MIDGCHVVVFTRDAADDRAFLRDVLELSWADAGGGWLVFALPPAEVAFHPDEANDRHALYLMCDDLAATMRDLAERGATFDEPADEPWGITTAIHLPGGGRIGLYEPKHPTLT